MFPLRSSIAFAALAALTACGADRAVTPTAEYVDGVAGALTTASTISAEYDLSVGQSVKINPKSTSRTNRLKWTTTNSKVAMVNSTGSVMAVANGNATVTASGSGVLESYAIVVAPAARQTSFSLLPSTSVTLNVGQTQQFSTSETWSDGVSRTSAVTYRATGGTISSSGLFTAGNLAGTFMVIASCACGDVAIADTTPVTVNLVAQLTKLTVSPKTVSLTAGATQQFTVSANWSTGATDVPPVVWSATGGTVNSNGAYVAPTTAGTFRVIVAHSGGTARDTAVITVASAAPPPPTSNTFGAGPNAPAWSNKTVYQEELFNTPIPVHYADANAAGFKGWQGFDGAWGTVYNPTRVKYPTISTPLGTKPVLEINFPGSSHNVSALNATTGEWPTNQKWGVSVSGNWSGALLFERSTDGVNWAPVSLRGSRAATGSNSQTGSETMVNGVWVSDEALTVAGGKFRVRAVSWSSGTANVAIGMQGGAAPARMSAGSFTGNPTKIYSRVLVFVDRDWTNGGNTGTKFFFFSQLQGNNHYVNLTDRIGLSLQGSSFRNLTGLLQPANGTWLDLELLLIANTPGIPNGVAMAWINGIPAVSASDVMYFAASAVPGFSSLWMDPTYGGGEAPPPRNISFKIAAWYRQSSP